MRGTVVVVVAAAVAAAHEGHGDVWWDVPESGDVPPDSANPMRLCPQRLPREMDRSATTNRHRTRGAWLP